MGRGEARKLLLLLLLPLLLLILLLVLLLLLLLLLVVVVVVVGNRRSKGQIVPLLHALPPSLPHSLPCDMHPFFSLRGMESHGRRVQHCQDCVKVLLLSLPPSLPPSLRFLLLLLLSFLLLHRW